MSEQHIIIRKSFDKIYETCNKVCVAYGNDYIPLPTLRLILNKSKLKTNRLGKFKEKYNKCLDALYEASSAVGENNNGRLPINILEMYIDTLKTNL